MRFIIAAVVSLVVLLTGPAVVTRAVAEFLHASPGPDDVVASSPARVDIYTTVATSTASGATQAIVEDQNGRRVDLGDLTVDPADHAHFSVGLEHNLPAGRYVVVFKTVGEYDLDHDGGQYAFYVGTAPTKADLAADHDLALTNLAGSPAELSGYRRGLLDGGLTVVLAIPVVVYLWWRRRRVPADQKQELH